MADEAPKSSPINNVLVLALIVAAFTIGILYTKVTTLEKSTKEQMAVVPAATAQAAAAQPPVETGPATEAITVADVTTYSQKKDAQICKEDGKPVVYLFSTTWCPHCNWIKDTFDKVVKEYTAKGLIVARHWEIDINDDILTTAKETAVPAEQMAIYSEFNPQGSIPTFVFGCKYFRIGNGYEQQQDLVSEEKEFRSLFDDLIKNS